MTDDHSIIVPESVEIEQHGEADVLHPMVRAMMSRPDFGTDELGRLMELQERHEKNQAEKAYNAARARLLADMPPIVQKNKKVEFGGTKYTYADLPQLMRAVMPALERHGFSISWKNQGDGRTESVTCILSHRLGHSESNTRQCVVEAKKGMSAVQSAQSTVTYLQRHALAAILGVVTDDTPDADAKPRVSPDDIDATRTLRAITALRRQGVPLPDAEAEIGKPAAQWTIGDLSRVKAWLDGRQGETPEDGPV